MLKRVSIILVTIILIIGIYNNVNAEANISIKVSFENEEKNVVLNISNIELLEEKCKWGISKTSEDLTVENWYDLEEYDISKKSAKIKLDVSDSIIKNIIKSTDTIFLYIKNKEDSIIVDKTKVDIKIPLTEAFTISKTIFYDKNVSINPAYTISALYDIEKQYYKLEKITDENIINKYKENKEINKFDELINENKIPENGWIEAKELIAQMDATSIKSIPNSILSSEPGIYYVWIKAEDEKSKTVYGVAIIEIEGENKEPEIGNNDEEQPKGDLPTETPKDDTTVTTGKLPQTGVSMTIVFVIIFAIALALLYYRRYSNCKDIK